MVARTKPADCCAPTWVEPLPAGRLQRLAAVARALSDPSRIEILRLLARQQGPMCACDIVGHFDLSQPTVSHHLRTLREAGLLRADRRGLWMFYSVDPDGGATLDGLSGLLEGA